MTTQLHWDFIDTASDCDLSAAHPDDYENWQPDCGLVAQGLRKSPHFDGQDTGWHLLRLPPHLSLPAGQADWWHAGQDCTPEQDMVHRWVAYPEDGSLGIPTTAGKRSRWAGDTYHSATFFRRCGRRLLLTVTYGRDI